MKKFSKLKIVFILSLLLFFYISICAISYARIVSNDLCENVFRLHVIANSDSQEDQNLKYIVRDNLIEYMNYICKNSSNKQEAISTAKSHINDFKKIALDTIASQGYNYEVNVSIGNFEFPTKNYGDISFPAGFYDALKVEIGSAKGQNWWCVMFPPLCFVDVSTGIVPEESKKELQTTLSDEEYALVSNTDNPGIKFKIKLLELFTNNGIITAKK